MSLASDFIRLGFSLAVKLYEPHRDAIRQSEIEGWLRFHCFDAKRFRRFVKAGLIKPFRSGPAKNSPLCYSKSEILKAFAAVKAAEAVE